MHEMIIHGCRGTVPVCHDTFMRYGGASTCFTVNTPAGVLIIDAGTGIKSADIYGRSDAIHLLFTHYHMDHVIGLPVFAPLYGPDSSVTLMGDPRREDNWRETLTNFMAKPYWPVGIGETAAKLTMTDLEEDADLTLGDVVVTWKEIPHPQGCLSFRIQTPSYCALIATDVEFPDDTATDSFLEFASDVTFLIFDAHYTPEEMASHRGWGHSSWKTACETAKKCGAQHLILTHHAPQRTDDEIDRIEAEAQSVFPETVAGYCGMPIWPRT